MDGLHARAGFGRRTSKLLVIASAVLVIVVITGALLARHYWPFTESAIRKDLASAASARVQFGSFHKQYFPPGCVAENVSFQRDASAPPFITIRRLTISSNLAGLLRHRVGLFRAEGTHVIAAPNEFGRNQVRKQTTIDNFVANDAVLEVSEKNAQPPLRFIFHRFSLQNLNGQGTTTFAAEFDNPEPHGVLKASGQFGPWNSNEPVATPVSGSYSLERADLGVFHSIGGTVSSTGTFNGTLKELGVEGSTHSPEFVVAKTRHGIPLDTRFSALVDATKGDVTLRSVTAHFGKDLIDAHGSIARRQDGHRSAIIDLDCNWGRIEDTFYPFIHTPSSPLAGDVAFQMHVTLPSGHEPFLKKIQLDSTFKIQNAKFTNPQTEIRVSRVSSPPEQDDNQTLADFQGSVTLRGRVAHFSSLSVHDRDAAALLRGNFDLTDHKVNLHGNLKTAASLTKTTHGIKAVFAKAIEPFFKKKPHKTVVPVHIGGTYSHPSFGLDLGS
ncbi:MAG: hypothetical protein DMG93_20290 [Acidobacteria bacterium]|nr:MAG: hypothetical protein DMG93_20290 [Acidobacteriota bacterium]